MKRIVIVGAGFAGLAAAKALRHADAEVFVETSVQDLEQATGVRKSGLYAEFKDKEDLFVESLRRYFDVLMARGHLTKQPLGSRA